MKKIIDTETLIISDLHLGRPECQALAILEVLYTTAFRRLILLGDIFHSGVPYGLPDAQWLVVNRIHRLSNPNRRPQKEVIWVTGNHDRKLKMLMVNLLGTRQREDYDEYRWTAGGKAFLAAHGDKYDFLYGTSKLFTRTAESITHLDSVIHIPRWIRKLSQFTHTPKVMEAGAVARGKFVGADAVFCGHTHHAKYIPDNHQEKHLLRDVAYYNTGAWVEPGNCHFVTVSENGEALLRKFEPSGRFSIPPGKKKPIFLSDESDEDIPPLNV